MAKKIPQPATTTTLIKLADEVELVRFERNLGTLGFFGTNDHTTATSREIKAVVTRGDRRINVSWEFNGSAKFGLPSTACRDKFMVFMKIADESRNSDGVITNPIRFTGYRMIKELGLSPCGDLYDDIDRWGRRMVNTTITSEQMVYLAAKKIYSDKTVSVFRSFERMGSMSRGNRQEMYEVYVEDWLLENLNHRYVILLDLNAYKRLNRPTARGIFNHLYNFFSASDGRTVEKNYADLCAVLHQAVYTRPSKIKYTIGKSLDELVEIKYLSSWELLPLRMKEGFKLVLHEGTESAAFRNTYRKLQKPDTKALEDAPMSAEQTKALNALLEIGVVPPSKAKSLAANFSPEEVLDQIEYVHTLGYIKNLAGFVITQLEGELSVPATFKSKRKAEEATKRAEEQQSLEYQLQNAYREWVELRIDEEIRSRYSQAELQVQVRKTIDRIKQDDTLKSFFRFAEDQQKEQIATQYLRKEIREELALPLLGQWIESNRQPSLFFKRGQLDS